jgi:nucleotide-binding universal stress UspA family protein
MFKRIVIAVDPREATATAVEQGGELARQLGAAVALVHVVDPSLGTVPEAGVPPTELLTDFEKSGEDDLESVRQQLPADLQVEEFLREGKPVDEILAVADEWRADLIVVGLQHHSGLVQRLLPSTTETVVRHAPCSVLVIPPEASE